jgi:hypothetical protein
MLTTNISRKKKKYINSICVKECCNGLKTFAEIGSITEDWKNDKTSILAKKLIDTDTVEFKLIKGTTEYNLNDSTYGTFYNTFTSQPLYVGYVIDWNKILNILGAGNYYYKIIKTIAGESETEISNYFNLQEYSDERADTTVRIETWNNGTILNSEFIYKDLLPNGWYQSIRINGLFSETTPKTVIDNYFDTNNKIVEIQKKRQLEYKLETWLLQDSISEHLMNDMMMSDKILITDSNVFNKRTYTQIEVSHVEDTEKTFNFNNNSNFIIKFVPKYDNIIKNNY